MLEVVAVLESGNPGYGLDSIQVYGLVIPAWFGWPLQLFSPIKFNLWNRFGSPPQLFSPIKFNF